MSEKGMRGKVVKALKELDAFAVENPLLPGTPDVNYAEGWIELKWLRSWPAKPETIVKIDHYTSQQKLFARVRERKKGKCFLLLQCKREWMLFRGAVAADYLNRTTREDLTPHCVRYWKAGFKAKEFLEFFKSENRDVSKVW